MTRVSVRLALLSLLTGALVSACVLSDAPLLPAIPAERQLDEATASALVAPEEPPYAEMVLTVPDAFPPWQPVRLEPQPRRKTEKAVSTAAVVREANKLALVAPSRSGFFGGRAEQRFIYQPGMIYEIPSSPNHPTTIHLPPGEHLAAAPVINSCPQGGQTEAPAEDGAAPDPNAKGCWVVGAAEMGEGPLRHDVVILRPSRAGLESTMPLLTVSGRAYYCRVRSQAEQGLIGVTWELPVVVIMPTAEAGRGRSSGGPPRAPVISLDRLFTQYTISVVSQQRPPWVPVQVFDTGTVTVVRFKEHLRYTAAPALFGVYADRAPALVEFVPYEGPDGSLDYIAQGLYPELRLKGQDGMEVKIVRGQTNGS